MRDQTARERMTVTESGRSIQCGQCHSQLPPDATFCGFCGQLLVSEDSKPSEKFCLYCGKQVRKEAECCEYCGSLFETEPLREVATDSDELTSVEGSMLSSIRALCNRFVGNPFFILGLLAVGLIVLWVIDFERSDSKQTATGFTEQRTASASPTPPPKILSKDPQFVRLLHPPDGDVLLQLSAEYSDKNREIESKLASIQDPELRNRVSTEEWSKVDKAGYIKREQENLRASFPAAMLAVLQRHRADWFEVGHIEYPGTDVLRISSVEASPVVLPDGATIPMDVATMDSVYLRFREVAKSDIENRVSAWLNSDSMNICRGVSGCNPPSNEQAHRETEAAVRKDRLILVGLGDLLAHRIDKLLLVDYESEAILLEVSPKAIVGNLEWKFPPENQSNLFSSAQYTVAPDSDTLKDFGTVPIHSEGNAQRAFSFSNPLSSAVTIDISFRGDEGGNFQFQNGCSSGTVYPGDSCKVTVLYVPKGMGAHRATMDVGGEGWAHKTVTFNGFGTWPWDVYRTLSQNRPPPSHPKDEGGHDAVGTARQSSGVGRKVSVPGREPSMPPACSMIASPGVLHAKCGVGDKIATSVEVHVSPYFSSTVVGRVACDERLWVVSSEDPVFLKVCTSAGVRGYIPHSQVK